MPAALETSTTPTEGPDVITGTPGPDTIDGLGGDDRIAGLAGNDTLIGGSGADSLDGGLGNDSLTGGDGNDVLTDADGTGTLNGGDGDDVVMLGAMSGGSADGGEGIDELRFDLATAAAGVSISLDLSGGSIGGSLGGVGISGFEELGSIVANQTTEHDDTITFGAAFDRYVRVDLLGGNDTYAGGRARISSTAGPATMC